MVKHKELSSPSTATMEARHRELSQESGHGETTRDVEAEDGPRTAPADVNPPHHRGFSFFVAMAFTLNYIVGSGFLTIPWAMSQTGCILGFFLLLLLTFFGVCSAIFVVEAMARAGHIKDRHESATQHGTNSHHRRLHGVQYENVATESTSNPLGTTAEIDKSGHTENSNELDQIEMVHHNGTDAGTDTNIQSTEVLLVGEHKFEMPLLCLQFLGKWGLRLYTLSVMLYFYGTLWAYSAVFAKSFDIIFGQAIFGRDAYGIFLFVFSCFVVPISMLELTEQVILQVALSVWRVIMLAVMVSTIIISAMFHVNSFSDFDYTSSTSEVSKFQPSRMYILLPVVTYANIFHHSIPALAQPVRDKTQVGNIFSATLSVCFVAYLAIGLSVALYFGDHMATASNLNWATYVGVAGPSRSWMLKFIAVLVSRFVVLFPACDVASAFPLNAITLGNNLMANLLTNSRIAGALDPKRTKIFCRGISAIPPIIGAYFLQDIGKITAYTGLCGIAISFVFPPLLSYFSERQMKSQGLPHETFYKQRFANSYMRFTICAFGLFVIVYVFACNVLGLG
jgi:amino acid permease